MISASSISNPSASLTERKKKKDIAISAVGFKKSDNSEIYIGDEIGHIYKAQIHNLGISKEITPAKELVVDMIYRGHFGLITSLDFNAHLLNNQSDPLLLTSSVDGTCQIWSERVR